MAPDCPGAGVHAVDAAHAQCALGADAPVLAGIAFGVDGEYWSDDGAHKSASKIVVLFMPVLVR